MKIKAFRVTSFRSVLDTGWLTLSSDGVTALVGQNESGKSAILDALAAAFSKTHVISQDDFRRGTRRPEVHLRLDISTEEISSVVNTLSGDVSEALVSVMDAEKSDLILSVFFFPWDEKGQICRAFRLGASIEDAIKEMFSGSDAENSGPESSSAASDDRYAQYRNSLATAIWNLTPSFVLFREEDSSLPNFVDIDEQGGTWLEGSSGRGAENFLASAGLRLSQLLIHDDRERSSLISTAIRAINSSLATYWTQILGAKGRIRLEMEFVRHPADHPRAGRPYLRFWISEGEGEKLHPSQRSKGTRWFVAFFLQLTAARRYDDAICMLLDEPGAYLHATAQGDVLRLIETLAHSIPVIYSTHSPYLIDHKRIDRILAVERDTSTENSDTIVRSGLALAASSHLTLAPILALMGVDLSTQQIIRREGNVLLEENSAYFYLSAFILLTGVGGNLALVACNGADNVKLVADLFVAWRLDYKIALDDDDKGRRVSREIKKKWMISDEESARKIILFDGCGGIEDAFERGDFQRFVVKDVALPEGQSNSKSVEAIRLSKPLLSSGFYTDVVRGLVKPESLAKETLERFRGWLTKMSS